jgi:predicted deacylase
MTDPLVVAGKQVPRGSRATIEIPVIRRYARNEVQLPAEVVNGSGDGPRLFLCAAIHGDELNGVEIIRRVLRRVQPRRLNGALLAVPIVNIYGFVSLTRYLPDRRDLNRSFPGSPRGSLAARLAHVFVREIVENATHGIDLHTGAVHRANLPQVRACLDDPATEALARAFGVPVIIDANVRDGSLRQAVLERSVPMLLYEAGEALRFDETAIRAGVNGVLSVMHALGMIRRSKGAARAGREPFVARSSHWVRAPDSGILRSRVRLGAVVRAGDVLARVADPLGVSEVPVVANHSGIVIGRAELPLANEGDALFHVATFERLDEAAATVDDFQEKMGEPRSLT